MARSASHTLTWKLVPRRYRVRGAFAAPGWREDGGGDRPRPLGVIDDFRVRPFLPQPLARAVPAPFVGEIQRAQPARGGREQRLAEGAGVKAVADGRGRRLCSCTRRGSPPRRRRTGRAAGPAPRGPGPAQCPAGSPSRARSFFAASLVRNCSYFLGLMPTMRLNSRWKWNSLSPAAPATSARSGRRSLFSSIKAMARSMRR